MIPLGCAMCCVGFLIFLGSLVYALGDLKNRPPIPSTERPFFRRFADIYFWTFLGHPRCRDLFRYGWLVWFVGVCFVLSFI